MSSPIHSDIIDEIDAYCERHSLTATAFGSMAMNDPNFVADLRAGRELRRATEQEIREFLTGEPYQRPKRSQAAA